MNKIEKAKGKAKAKIAKKIGKNAKEAVKSACVLIAFAAIAAIASGCSTTGEQPARSQTANVEIRDCTITITMPQSATLGTNSTCTVEFITQTQANEGSETISPTATPTNTVDTDAALDIPVNKANSGTSAAGGAAEKLLGAGADWLSGKISGSGNEESQISNSKSQISDSKTETKDEECKDCTDGSCTDCTDGACEDCEVK